MGILWGDHGKADENLGKWWKKSGWYPCPWKHVGKWMKTETWAMNINLRQLETETGMISIVFWCLTSLGPSHVSNGTSITLLDMTPFRLVLSPMLHLTA
jgi:hypothetical protein